MGLGGRLKANEETSNERNDFLRNNYLGDTYAKWGNSVGTGYKAISEKSCKFVWRDHNFVVM